MLRQLAALSLARDSYVEVFWAPTWATPSDAFSRGAPMAAWHLKASLDAKAVFGSLMDMSDYLLEAQVAWNRGCQWAQESHRAGPHIVDFFSINGMG